MATDAFNDATLETGAWCSRLDCSDNLADIHTWCNDDTARLDRAISRATGTAQSILRARWPEEWPFSGDPPDELRQAVAVIAVRQVFFGRGLPESLTHLDAERDAAELWLREVRDGDAMLVPTSEELIAERVAVTSKPKWEERVVGFEHATDQP